MPIYEYQCQQCDHQLERIQRMSDEPLRDCPACENPQLRRLVSAAAFRLKGGGWYETDFKQGQKRNLADSGNGENKAASSDSNGASKPAESKPAVKESAKADPKPAKADK
jgi:putative FmdB family regulatory protein